MTISLNQIHLHQTVYENVGDHITGKELFEKIVAVKFNPVQLTGIANITSLSDHEYHVFINLVTELVIHCPQSRILDEIHLV